MGLLGRFLQGGNGSVVERIGVACRMVSFEGLTEGGGVLLVVEEGG